MSAYINVNTMEYPRYIGDIQLINPEVTEETIPQNWQHVLYTEPPEYTHATQTAYELAPIQQNGNWTVQWAIRDLTQEELDARAVFALGLKGAIQFNTDVAGSEPDVIG
jgi:hypothetical protein